MGHDFLGLQDDIKLTGNSRLSVSKPKPPLSVSHESFNQENHSSGGWMLGLLRPSF